MIFLLVMIGARASLSLRKMLDIYYIKNRFFRRAIKISDEVSESVV